MLEIVIMFVIVFVIWGGSEIVMFWNRKLRNKTHIDLGGLKVETTKMSQELEDVIENAVKLRFEMTKAGYEYVNGSLERTTKGSREYTGWCMYQRRLDNHVRRFQLEHGIWTEQIVEGTLSELEQIP